MNEALWVHWKIYIRKARVKNTRQTAAWYALRISLEKNGFHLLRSASVLSSLFSSTLQSGASGEASKAGEDRCRFPMVVLTFSPRNHRV
jgi:hypothetical protein